MTIKLNGINPLAYLGVQAETPPNFRQVKNDPTVNTISGFQIGDQVVVISTGKIWQLTEINNNQALWVQIYPATGGGGGITTLDADTGSATGGTVTIAGGTNIGTVASGATLTVNLDNAVTISGNYTTTAGDLVANNGSIELTSTANTGISSLVSFTKNRSGGPVIINDDLGTITFTGFDGTNNQFGAAISAVVQPGITTGEMPTALVLGTRNVGDSGPVASLVIAPNHTIQIPELTQGVVQSSSTGFLSSSDGIDGQLLISANSGAPIWANITAGSGVTITNAANSITIASTGGGGGITTLDADTGSATGGTVTIAGGTNIGTVASGATLTVNLDNAVTISGNYTTTAGDLVANNGSIELTSTANTVTSSLVSFTKNRSGGTVLVGDDLGTLLFNGYDGTSNQIGAGISAITQTGVATGEMPTALIFATRNVGQSSPIVAFVIADNQAIQIPDLTAGVIQASSTGFLSSSEGTDGQLLIGSSTVSPEWANITAGSGVTITNASNSITISSTGGGGGIATLSADTGSATGGTVTIAGGTNIGTVASGATVTVNLDSSINVNAVTITDSTASAVGPIANFDKDRSGAIVQTADVLGDVDFNGFDGTSYINGARIRSVVDGTPGTGDMPGNLTFWTQEPAGSLTNRMTIGSDGSAIMTNTLEVANSISTISGPIEINDTSNVAQPAILGLFKSRAGGVITSGDPLGVVIFEGYDGTAFQVGAAIASVSSGTISSGNVPSDLQFATKPNSANPLTTRIVIDSAGVVTIEAPDAGAGLIVLGGGIDITGQVFFDTADVGEGVLQSNSVGRITGSKGTDGEILISSTSGDPIWATLTAGTGITITNATNSITIASSGSTGFAWTEVTTTSQVMAVNNGYITNNAALVTLTLPVSAAIGDTIEVIGKGSGGWLIAQNSGQTIHYGNATTTSGVTGSLASTSQRDGVTLVCTTANTDWTQTDSGNITVV